MNNKSKTVLKSGYETLQFFGLNPYVLIMNIFGIFSFFIKDYVYLKREIKNSKFRDYKIKIRPFLLDKYSSGGTAKGHYFHQDLLVAQKIYNNKPSKHVDIGSRVDGFVAHLAVFREVEVVDVREIESKIKNIKYIKRDFTIKDDKFNKYCDSISSLHAIEHFGLGRYGDNLDIFGSEKGIINMYEMLVDGGLLYLSFPIGKKRIEINAQRVFSLEEMIEFLKAYFDVISFSYVDDNGDLHENITLSELDISSNLDLYYGCGIFELRKKVAEVE